MNATTARIRIYNNIYYIFYPSTFFKLHNSLELIMIMYQKLFENPSNSVWKVDKFTRFPIYISCYVSFFF